MILDLTEQITQAQIATALVIIAVSLVYIAAKLTKKANHPQR